jgi:hypothetical protein
VFTKSLIAAGAAAGMLLTASPAPADGKGLYGSADPTFDGVYRQSLSILALTAADKKVPTAAVRWLKKQQCEDGGFMAHRADTDAACQPPDPVGFAGQDSNATAVATAALWHVGATKKSRQSARWLTQRRNTDGGWAYYPAPGAASDANSTALVQGALRLLGRGPSAKYLKGLQNRCETPPSQRGGIRFDEASQEANDNATAQVAWMLGGGLRLPENGRIAKRTPGLTCKGARSGRASMKTAARAYLTKRLRSVRGDLPYGGGYPGTDYAGAASGVLALANAGVSRKAVRTTSRFLQRSADDWITASGDDAPGALAMLVLVAEATGDDPRDFGGTNLVRRLVKTRT